MTTTMQAAGGTWQVDAPDRRVAALYAAAVGFTAGMLVLFSDPRLLGPVGWGWWLASGAVCAGLSTIVPIRRQAVGAAVVCPVFWLVGSAWVSYGYAHDPFWPPAYWVTGGVLTGICLMLAYTFATPTDYGLPAYVAGPAAGGEPDGPEEWASWVAAVTKGKVTGCHTFAEQEWATGTGATITGVMPADGSTWETLKPFEAGMAAALRLPGGGGVTVGPHGDAAGFRLDILREDAMAEGQPYPDLGDGDDTYGRVGD